ncbi:hypothetical protein TcBrA4_0070350 [Trypanosoma cruzi]|nr:hypothetical protein TcBrA4_0070350 [Trypanosoma cruzi]
MVLHSADLFERLLHHTLCSKFLFRIMNGGVRDTLFQCMFACSHTGHQTTLNYPLLGEFRKLLPTMVLHSADRFRAAAAPHVVVYVFVSNYECGSQSTLFHCMFACSHTGRQNNPELSAAWRNFASSCPQWCCSRRIVFDPGAHTNAGNRTTSRLNLPLTIWSSDIGVLEGWQDPIDELMDLAGPY